MKTNININRSPAVLAATALALILSWPNSSQSQRFFTLKGLLSGHFGGSERVSFVRVTPSAQVARSIARRVGVPLAQRQYTFYVAKSHGGVDGYALFDSELGQHEPIDMATFFDARGRIRRVEVVAYREAYGDGIRSARFRNQFVGRDADSGYRPNVDIDVVSGATISSHSMARGVHRAALLLQETVLKGDDARVHP